jgi:hypothetical protein
MATSTGHHPSAIDARLYGLRTIWLFVLYVALDVVCIGAGMGVPVFCILFGFLVGWVIVGRVTLRTHEPREVLRTLLKQAALISLVTFVGMLLVWGWSIPVLFGPEADLENFGHPMILYEPWPSLLGWLVLMIVISPILQLLTTVFGGHIKYSRRLGEGGGGDARAL